MKNKERNYKKILKNETIALLIISISMLIILCELYSSSDSHGLPVDLFINPMIQPGIYAIVLIVILFYIKKDKPFVGYLSGILSIIMIAFAAYSSLFGVIYLPIAVFYLYHSIRYLISNKESSNSVDVPVKKSKLPYLNLVFVILSFIMWEIQPNLSGIILGYGLSSFVFISSIILIAKKRSSIMLYIVFSLSIIALLFNFCVSIIIIPFLLS